MTFSLQATERTERGKQLDALRALGKIPAIVYGPKESPSSITVDRVEFEKLLKQAGESSIISLGGVGKAKDVLVHDVAFDPQRGGVIHVDFYAVEAGKELEVDVPLVFVGEAPALKLGGTLTKVMHQVEVACEASKLPKEISVNIESLVDLDSQIHVSDLVLPAGVRVLNDATDVIVLVQAVAEETETVATIDMGAIEVEKKGKTEPTENK